MAPDLSSSPTSKGRVLVVDDAPELLELVSGLLRREGYEVLEATEGAAGVALVDLHHPDLVVLDLTLPDLDGMEVCRQIRQRSDAMIVMLTARDDEIDRVMGLKMGADDYVSKPFSPRELAARVEALLRRRRPVPAAAGEPPTAAEPELTFGDLVIRPLAREVLVAGEPVELTRIEFDILAALSGQPRVVFSRATLREHVWGPNWYGDDHVVDVHVANLRKKVDTTPGVSHLRTVRGVGYRMEG